MTGFHSKQDMAAGKQEDDPCPGCIVGTVCRTPNCGRLKLPVDHPFRNTKAALIASIIACRDMLDAQPVPTREPQRQWIWLSDADIAEVVDTTCQYTGSYEEYLIKKAERKIRSMNT